MYKLVKALGHIVTYFICAITIDKIDITESFFLSKLFYNITNN